MSDNTKIEWTDATWNPIRGCSRVSEGCRNCYAETVAHRFSGEGQPYEGLIARGGQWNGEIKVVDRVMDQPLRWRRPRRIFVNSMSDLFHENVPEAVIDQVFAVMALCRQHTFQVLTKRPDRMLRYLTNESTVERIRTTQFSRGIGNGGVTVLNDVGQRGNWPLPNVWLGVSVEDQKTASERIPLLLNTPAAVRWVSAEPLLCRVWFYGLPGIVTDDEDVRIDALAGTYVTSPRQEDSDPYGARIDWVVVGGESGTGARPMHPDWARSLRDQCAEAGVAFLFKQWGEWWPSFGTDDDMAAQYEFADGVISVSEHGSPPAGVAACSTGESDRVHIWPSYHWGDEPPPCDHTAESHRVGKKKAGRLLDGVQHDGYPAMQDHGSDLARACTEDRQQ